MIQSIVFGAAAVWLILLLAIVFGLIPLGK